MNGGAEGRRIPPFSKAEKYPRGLAVDFRKLDDKTLYSYVHFYNLPLRQQMSREELAVAVAKHFQLESGRVNEEETLGSFLSSYHGLAQKALGFEPPSKRHRSGQRRTNAELFGPAQEDEQVAARIDGEESGWILATVKKYHPSTDEFDVLDEDDDTKLIRLSRDLVIRLDEAVENLQKGDTVLAVFPDTTSFYRGRISKPVKNRSASSGGDSEVFVQFDDDEDETGRLPHRCIPARHVMPDPDEEEMSMNVASCLDASPPNYAELAACGLRKLPNGQGTIVEICDVLHDEVIDFLRGKGEDPRSVQWRALVRRALQSPPANSPFALAEGSSDIFVLLED
eukprot:CAMPEP_0118974930 /NCGR_PEP_ID=MMETSP1173-20130426/13937_1 /TAXON_ID=1034831 /ORGANISM="Rhizochromulina marina cf, Strain CCMP1243" /LENGTH=339 /DNA_ID=CAMNT_0006924745 /DNA_START=3 /DNA_END=1025 /DNA_ORIENTATION=-